jgi:hypothetical protein
MAGNIGSLGYDYIRCINFEMAASVQTSAKHAIGIPKMTKWMPTYWSPLSVNASFNLNKNM